ncbi:C-C chemokine receptor type 8-like [Rhinichthys klamathensis goyatoka]|uniref:C-C chemokine receptor type 8-like n=1 Tax=Rhinichthys klamathensis goyatoka TaxID=3034132 RepID=UPI0024B56657|nr:C-C chemokine receptor type 8-like [Rhinichthys klamathensis goyatoka]
MNNSAVNFTTPETFTNLTSSLLHEREMLESFTSGFNFMFGFLIHTYVLWLIVKGTGSSVASDFFNLNLSVCEILFSLNCLLSIVVNAIRFKGFTTLPPFLQGLAFTGRPLFQCLICVERYLAVVHPVTFLKYKPLRYRVICCTAAWIIILGSCLFCLFSSISNTFYIYSWFFSIQLLLFLSIQLFCLLVILKSLKQSGPGEKRREREEESHMKRRAFIIILITTVSMIIMLVPYTITGLVTAVKQFYSALWFISFMCFMLAGFVQPVLYLHRTRKLSCLFSFIKTKIVIIC